MLETKLSNKRQNILIFMCWLAYTVSYISRYSYNANQVAIISFYSTTKTVAGLVGTCYFVAYGIGQIVHGLLSKKYNKRFMIGISLITSSVLNLILFLKPSFEVYKYLWFINGASLSVLWPTLICVLSEKLDDEHLNKSIVVMSTTVAIGTAVSYGLSALFNLSGSFYYSFLIGFVCSLLTGIVWIMFYRIFSNTSVELEQKSIQKSNSSNNTSYRKNAIIMLFVLGLFAVVVNFTKDGLTTWVPNILKEGYGLSDSLSIILTIVLPIIGVFGTAFSMVLNKKIKSYILLSGIMFFMALICVLCVIIVMSKGNDVNLPLAVSVILLCFGFTSLLMHGINNVITGLAPLQMRESFNAGSLAGILNGCCYVGSAISSFGIGLIADKLSWQWVFKIIAICILTSVIITVICEITVKYSKRKTKKG